MLIVKNLKTLIEHLPDNARVIAYEGEGCGLGVSLGGMNGWIETGWSDEKECNPKKHDLSGFGIIRSKFKQTES